MHEDEFNAATVAAHNELAAAYAAGELEVPQPVDESLWALARKVSRVSVRTYNHQAGTEGFYGMPIPDEYRTIMGSPVRMALESNDVSITIPYLDHN